MQKDIIRDSMLRNTNRKRQDKSLSNHWKVYIVVAVHVFKFPIMARGSFVHYK